MPNKGFTLLELILVMALTATITAAMVPNLRNFNASQSLSDAASQMQSDLRQIQNSASSGLKCQINTATSWYFELAKDSSGVVKTYNLGAICLNNEVYSPIAHALPSGIKINQIDLDTCEVTLPGEIDQFRVYYSNIFGRVSFASNALSCGLNFNPQQAILYLKSDADPSLVNKVILNNGGAIYVQ